MYRDPVSDDEILFRSVRSGDVRWNGSTWNLSSVAFNSRDWKPSVDRRSIRPDPKDALKGDTDGIVQLLARDVRAVAIPQITKPNQKPDKYYLVDIVPQPIEEVTCRLSSDHLFLEDSRLLN